MFYLMLPFLAPLILLIVAGLSLRNPGRRPGSLPKLAEAAAFAAFLVAAVSAVLMVAYGPGTSALIGAAGVG
ncbi:MAG: oxidoreductase, partial [Proteobacteria bacterium]|nr:oxidoreductase [Pseudomonadota bacterium]